MDRGCMPIWWGMCLPATFTIYCGKHRAWKFTLVGLQSMHKAWLKRDSLRNSVALGELMISGGCFGTLISRHCLHWWWMSCHVFCPFPWTDLPRGAEDSDGVIKIKLPNSMVWFNHKLTALILPLGCTTHVSRCILSWSEGRERHLEVVHFRYDICQDVVYLIFGGG